MANRTRDRLINIRVNDSEYEAIKRLAKERGKSISALIRNLVEEDGMRERSASLVEKTKLLLNKVLDEKEAIRQQKEEALVALNKALAMLDHIETTIAQAYERKEAMVNAGQEEENKR